MRLLVTNERSNPKAELNVIVTDRSEIGNETGGGCKAPVYDSQQ